LTLNAADYSAVVTLRDGCRAEIRALKASDEADFFAAVRRIGAPSLYKRFFGAKQEFSAAEIAFFVNVDFVTHVALVVEVDGGGHSAIVGGGRYVVVQPGTAELAFAVVDEYQGRGVGTALMCHLIALARNAGLKELTADALSDNIAMMTVFQRSGLRRSTSRRGRFVRVTLSL
jgi:RimJ/RimL family protein N-acetyltransferase